MFHPATDWKSSRAIVAASTAFESMIDGGFVLNGGIAMRTKSKSPITTKNKKLLPAVHPGEVLAEDFLKPLGITQYRLAQSIHVPRRRINEIVLGGRSITADTSLRLARFFGTSERFWLNLQATYDLNIERDRISETLKRIEVLKKAS